MIKFKFITSICAIITCAAFIGVGSGLYVAIESSNISSNSPNKIADSQIPGDSIDIVDNPKPPVIPSGPDGIKKLEDILGKPEWSNQLIQVNNNPSNNWKQFSKTNSFRIQLEVKNPKQQRLPARNQGTAWSWYYTNDVNSPIYEWYLLTNFHVVSKSLEFVKENPSLGSFNHNKTIFTLTKDFYIDLEICDINSNNNQSKYVSIIKNPLNNEPLFSKAQIISDDEIQDFDLFSANENNPMQNYNLDIAMIKFEFNKNEVNQFLNKSNFNLNNVANPYANYLQANNNKLSNNQLSIDYQINNKHLSLLTNNKPVIETKIDGVISKQLVIKTSNIKANDEIKWLYRKNSSDQNWTPFEHPPIQDSQDLNTWKLSPEIAGQGEIKVVVNNIESEPVKFNIDALFYIAGNPASDNKLVFSQMNSNSFKQAYLEYPINNSMIKQPIYLCANSISNWKLTSGASGSAVYKINSANQNLIESYPFGIYWGEMIHREDTSITASFAPLIYDFVSDGYTYSYNVYDNFSQCLRLLASY